MVKHIVWFTLKDEAEGASAAENAAKMVSMLTALNGEIPTLHSIEASAAVLETSTEPVGVILQTVHDDAEGLNAYNIHPKHQECVKFIKEVVSSRRAIDYVI